LGSRQPPPRRGASDKTGAEREAILAHVAIAGDSLARAAALQQFDIGQPEVSSRSSRFRIN
jgi:hypothetical protein